jgi:hypothetical protein
MEIYSEYMEGDRKATVTRLQRSEWAREFDVWEVALYVQGKPIQRTTVRSEPDAENLAEDFVRGGCASAPTLLNEHISNG